MEVGIPPSRPHIILLFWNCFPSPIVHLMLEPPPPHTHMQGLCLILENRLSHPLMVDLLPLMQSMLHDSSEKVRIAFLDLLLLVKGMRMIKFWHICPLEHLLGENTIKNFLCVLRCGDDHVL